MQRSEEELAELICKNIGRQTLLAVEDALIVGAKRAYEQSHGMHRGHRRSVLGQLRHFHMNETFHQALESSEVSPTPLNGSSVVVGRSGILSLGRFNVSSAGWASGRRSNIRRHMAEANKAIEEMVQPGLFEPRAAPKTGSIFFVACFPHGKSNADAPPLVYVALPDAKMQGWVFKRPLSWLLERSISAPSQEDKAMPKLKKNMAAKGVGGDSA
jgi:hypothetical protein